MKTTPSELFSPTDIPLRTVSLSHLKKPISSCCMIFKPTSTHQLYSYISISLPSDSILLALTLCHLKQSLTFSHPLPLIPTILYPPKQFEPYNHPTTIQTLLHILFQKLTSLSTWQEWIEVVNQYPIFGFCLGVYARGKGLEQMKRDEGKEYEMEGLGNEKEVLEDWGREARFMALRAVTKGMGLGGVKIDRGKGVEETVQGVQKGEMIELEIQGKQVRLKIIPPQSSLSPSSYPHTIPPPLIPQLDPKEQRLNRSIGGKTCIKCGKIKTSKFCECRKSTPSRPSKQPLHQVTVKQFNPIEFHLNSKNLGMRVEGKIKQKEN